MPKDHQRPHLLLCHDLLVRPEQPLILEARRLPQVLDFGALYQKAEQDVDLLLIGQGQGKEQVQIVHLDLRQLRNVVIKNF